MSYANGRIYVDTSKTPNEGVGIYDVQRALSTNRQDLGELCTHQNINIWAKFKPIYHTGVAALKNSQRHDNSHSVPGYTISWGIKKPSSVAWASYINAQGVVQSGLWGYDKPTGGTASPYRLTDYAEVNDSGVVTGHGYDRNAKPPIQFILPSESTMNVPYTPQSGKSGSILMFMFTFQNGVVGWSSNTCLSLGDVFSDVLDYYPTVILTCYSGGRVYEYSKSGDSKIRTYTGNVNPIVQVPVDTNELALAAQADGASPHSGPLADNAKWTACMVLTSGKIEGTVESHIINNKEITRLEYTTGADRKDFTVRNISNLDYITSLSYTVTLIRTSTGYYYINNIYVSMTMEAGRTASFNVNATFTCLLGVIGGTGWSGNNQSERRDRWAACSGSGNLSPSTEMPEYRFSGDVYPGQRIAHGDLTFTDGSLYLTGSFNINVAGGASSYSQTVTIK